MEEKQEEIKNLVDVRNATKAKLKGICGVYRKCDGRSDRLCQHNMYGKPIQIGGLGSGASFANNIIALDKIKLKTRLIGEDFKPDSKWKFLNKDLSMPIMAASVSGVHSFGSVVSEKDFCEAIINGSKNAGTIGWRGDSYNYSLENPWGINAIKDAGGWGIKIIKPRSQELMLKFIDLAEKANVIAVGTDIDGCGSFAMAQHTEPVFRKTIKDLKDLVNSTKLPFIVKGIMCLEDAEDAIKAGASVIVVSNHGGRVLDHTPGTAEILPKIASEFKGTIPIIVDGGVRTGFDVIKMLALGADGVMNGRDTLRAAVGAGSLGVQLQLEMLQKTLKKAMVMTNTKDLMDIDQKILYKN